MLTQHFLDFKPAFLNSTYFIHKCFLEFIYQSVFLLSWFWHRDLNHCILMFYHFFELTFLLLIVYWIWILKEIHAFIFYWTVIFSDSNHYLSNHLLLSMKSYRFFRFHLFWTMVWDLLIFLMWFYHLFYFNL